MYLTPIDVPCGCGDCPQVRVTVITRIDSDLENLYSTMLSLEDSDLVVGLYRSEDEAAQGHSAFCNTQVLRTIIALAIEAGEAEISSEE